MTDIEQKALDMVLKEDGGYLNYDAVFAVLCRAIEQHEAYKQEVSDAMEEYCKFMPTHFPPILNQFIIPAPKPDPLVEVMKTFGSVSNAEDFRAALDALGFEIREKGQ
jgi:hypothetical protein